MRMTTSAPKGAAPYHGVGNPAGKRKIEGKHLQDWLRGMEGEWRLLPSPEGLFVLQNIDEPVRKRMGVNLSLFGEIGRQGELPDIINLICMSRWGGVLYVYIDDIVKVLAFKDGDVYEARSNAPEDLLGEVACRYGVIDRDQLTRALSECGNSQRFGAYLVERGYITPVELFAVIQRQVEEIFYGLLTVDAGQFSFCREDLPAEVVPRLLLSTQNLLLQGFQRIDELSYFRSKISSSSVVFEKVHWKGSQVPCGEAESMVLRFVDGKRNLEAIAQETRLGEFGATKAAFQLLQMGLIKPVTMDQLGSRGLQAKEEGLYRVIELFNEVFSRIISEVKAQGRGEEILETMRSFFSSATVYSDLFRGVSLGADGTIAPDVLVANIERAKIQGNEVEFLYQGLSEYLFFITFIAGETLDSETENKLHERLGAILRESAIDIQTPIDDLDGLDFSDI